MKQEKKQKFRLKQNAPTTITIICGLLVLLYKILYIRSYKRYSWFTSYLWQFARAFVQNFSATGYVGPQIYVNEYWRVPLWHSQAQAINDTQEPKLSS